MHNFYFVLHAVEMPRYFKPCNSNYMPWLCERLVPALYLEIFNRFTRVLARKEANSTTSG
jgi:hypothetical protein